MRRRTLLLTLAFALAALVQTASFAPLLGAFVGASLIGLMSGQGRRMLVWLCVAVVIGGGVFGPLIKDRVVQQEAHTSPTTPRISRSCHRQSNSVTDYGRRHTYL